MEQIINKLASFYHFPHRNYTYKIEFYLDVFACLFMNIIGAAWLVTPLIYLGIMISKSPLEFWNFLTLDNFIGFCLFGFFNYGLSYIFFMHNRNNLGGKLMFLGCAFFALGALITLGTIGYHFLKWQIKGLSNISQNMDVFYFDLSVILIISAFFFFRSNAFKNFLDRTLSRY